MPFTLEHVEHERLVPLATLAGEQGRVLGSGTFTAAGDIAGPFSFLGKMNLVLSGAFSGSVELEDSYDGGITWVPATTEDGVAATLTGPRLVPGRADRAGRADTAARCVALVRHAGLAVLAVTVLRVRRGGGGGSSGAAGRAGALARLPDNQDTSARGYAPGHLWLPPGSRRLWECKRAIGSAVWEPRASDAALPGDAIPVAPAIAVGTRRLLVGYGGPGLALKRASDGASLDIGFLPDGTLDAATMDRFLRGTTGVVTRVYDQSGNGRDLTAANDAEAPAVTPFDFLGPNRTVFFDDNNHWGSTGHVIRRLQIPASFTAHLRNLAAVALLRSYHSNFTIPLLSFTPQNAPYTGHTWAFGWRRSTGWDSLAVASTNQTGAAIRRVLTPSKPSVTPFVCGFSHSADAAPTHGPGGVRMWHDERHSLTVGNVEDDPLATYAGGTLGTVPGWNCNHRLPETGGFHLGAMLLYDAPITQAQYNAVNESYRAHFQAPPQRRGRIICDGDSITHAPNADWHQTWPARAAELSAIPAEWFNVAVSGSGYGVQAGAFPNWDQILDPTAPFNLVFVACGTNDLTNGQTADALIGTAQAYINTVKAGGFQVMIDTIPPFSTITADEQTHRLAYNAHLRANWRQMGAIGCPDLASEPTMGLQSSTLDASLYFDGKHPTQLGLQYFAAWRAPRIDAALQAAGLA